MIFNEFFLSYKITIFLGVVKCPLKRAIFSRILCNEGNHTMVVTSKLKVEVAFPSDNYLWLTHSDLFLFQSSCLSVQSLSHAWLFVTPWTAAPQASLSIINSWSLLNSLESAMPSNHFILCWDPSPPTFNLSQHQGLFQWVFSRVFSFTSGLKTVLPVLMFIIAGGRATTSSQSG